MPRSRFFNLPVKERQRLLTIATKHFAKDGFEGASLNAILAEARVSKGAYYYYFEDKEDLYAAALESGFEELFVRMRPPEVYSLSRDAFWPTMERFVREWAKAFDTSSDLFRAALHITEEQRNSARFAPMIARGQSLHRALIETGQRLGCVRTDLPMEALLRLVGAVDAAMDSFFLSLPGEYGPERLEQHLSATFDAVKRVIAIDPEDAAVPPARRKGARKAAKKPRQKRPRRE